MPLSNDIKKSYKNLGHNLKPVVTIAGKGLSDGVQTEIIRALTDHELIKIKIAIEDREVRNEVVAELCKSSKSELVQQIGKVALIYRKSDKKDIKTSNVR